MNVSKNMIYENVNDRLLLGAKKLASVVGCTMGPKGENVVINRLSGNPAITKDGVTVARNIELEDRVENIAVRIIKEVALSVVEDVGDGTTSGTVLTEALLRNGKDVIQTHGISPIDVKRKFDELTELTLAELEKMKINITEDNKELLLKVATISANNDVELGKIIYDAITRVGINGVVKVVPSTNKDTFVTSVEGISYPNGYLNQYLISSPNSNKADYKNVKIALFDKKLESLKEVQAVLQNVNDTTPILFIASDYSEEVISMLVINNNQKSRIICAIRAPEFGDYRRAVIRDYALYTGARICTVSEPFRNVACLGNASSIMVTKKDHTLFMDEANRKQYEEKLPEYLEGLNNLLREADNDFDRDKLTNRIAKLQGNVALIHVGAKSELELSEKLDRVEDSLLATQAAVRGGILPGGGTALIKAFDKVVKSSHCEDCGNIAVAYFQSISAPFTKIMANANIDSDSILAYGVKLTHTDSDFKGYDVSKVQGNTPLTLVDLLKVGVIDPYLVTKSVLTNAVSVASLLMTTNNVVEHFDEATPYYS